MKYDKPGIQQLLRNIRSVPATELQSLLLKLMSHPFAFEFAVAASPIAADHMRKAFTLETSTILSNSSEFYLSGLARIVVAPSSPQVASSLNREDSFSLAIGHRRISACIDALVELRNSSLVTRVEKSHSPILGRRPNMLNYHQGYNSGEASLDRQEQWTKEHTQKPTPINSRPNFSARPFSALGIPVPLDSAQANAVAWQVVHEFLETDVEAALRVLERPSCIKLLEAALLATSSTHSAPAQTSISSDLTSQSGFKPKLPKIATQPSETPAQSIKGALSLEHIKEFGPWGIHLSSRAERDIRQARNGDQNTFKIILKKIKQLSDGHFSDDNQKKLTGREVPIPIYEAKMSRDSRLVYRIDCVADYGSEDERQILVIYGVYTHSQLERGQFWNSVGLQISHRGREYRKRCSTRGDPIDYKGDKVFHPQSFPAMNDYVEHEDTSDLSALSIPQHDLGELHELLVLEKFTPLSRALLNSMFANVDVTHPFNPSPFEKKIIEHPASCYVIGRSGTGKTTTLLFRLLAREHAYKALNDQDPGAFRRPRQLFVTQSRVLAGKVEEYYRRLHESMNIADYTLETLKTPSTAVDLQDSRLGHGNSPGDLWHEDDEQNYRADLPKKFSELRDEHFPLFLTMEKLSEMIEADVEADGEEELVPQIVGIRSARRTMRKRADRTARRTLMTYKTWLSEYWPHFAEHLTKGLDAALVYSEIMGVLKGSEESLMHSERHLSLEAYENFSSRRQSTFASHRNRIYDIFTAFRRKKEAKGHVDAADRTHAILGCLQADIQIIGQPVDFLYVDEAQDNLLIDALMLRFICCNPDGLFWAGDTAQTISVGSSFRFNDLRAFIHRIDKRVAEDAPAFIAQEPPALFELVVNYRSHGGIVSCAHSIIGLIKNFWPNSIDNLAEERGVVEGGKPVFFYGNARYDQFLFGSNDNRIEFGAKQGIIVRDEESKQRLCDEVGSKIGLVYTVFEAKGLEFDDVLIFDFFSDSTVTHNQWRVVLNAMPKHEDGCSDTPAPAFDSIRHAGVCADLKSLYVAVTRARKNLWIADRSDKGEPMRMVWSANNQVQNCTPETVPHIATGSSREEWAIEAHKLFKHKRFSQAALSFERANQPQQAAVATAYHLRQIAEEKPVSEAKKFQEARSAAYLAAGEAFEMAASSKKWEFGTRARAGYFRIAGECLQQAGKLLYPRAALCFEQAHDFMTAAKLYREAVRFDDAVRVIREHNLETNQDDATVIMRAAKLHYFNTADVKKGCELFDDAEDALEYLDARGLDAAQVDVLVHLERWADAADVHLQEGRMLTAAELLLKDSSKGSALRAKAVVLTAISEQVSFGRVPKPEDPTVCRIQELLAQLEDRKLTGDIRNQIAYFNILLDWDIPALKAFAEKLNDIQVEKLGEPDEHYAQLLLALHTYFIARPSTQLSTVSLSVEQVLTRLKLTLSHVRLLRARLVERGPVHNLLVQRLFGFRPYGDHEFIVARDTFLGSKLELRLPDQTIDDSGIIVSEDLLQDVYRSSLFAIIKEEVSTMTELWSQKLALDFPCLPFFFSGRCNRPDCSRTHVREGDYTPAMYTTRVKAHMLPLMILAAIDGLSPRQFIASQERIWSAKLYQMLRPFSEKLGNPSMLPVAEVAHPAALAWIRPQLYRLRELPGLPPCDYTTAIRCVFFSSYLPNVARVQGLLRGTPLLRSSYALRMSEHPRAAVALGYAMDAINGPPDVPESLQHGIDFLHLIITRKVPFDVAMFVDLVEDFMSSLFISSTIHTQDSNSTATLPRSWLLSALHRNISLRLGSEYHLSRLVEAGQEYLAQLLDFSYSGLSYLGRPIVRPIIPHGVQSSEPIFLPHQIRNSLIARMCNAVCLVGIHSSRPKLQTKIVSILQILKQQPSRPQYVQFHRVETWRDALFATRHHFHGSKLDCMVQVGWNDAEEPHVTTFDGSAYIVLFKSLSELEERLRGIVPGRLANTVATSCPQQRQALPPVPHSALQSIAAVRFAQIEEASRHASPSMSEERTATATTREATFEPSLIALTTVEDAEIEEVEALGPVELLNGDAARDSHTDDQSPPKLSENPQDVPEFFSGRSHRDRGEPATPVDEEQLKQATVAATTDDAKHEGAARTIQKWLRRRTTNSLRDSAVAIAVTPYWTSYRKAAEGGAGGKGYYRLVMLGFLPHLILALKLAEDQIMIAKNTLKKQLKSVDPAVSAFDALDGQLTSNNSAFKDLKKHREALKPTAPVHVARNREQLENLVAECIAFLTNLPGRVPTFDLSVVADDIELARVGILRPRT